jgi:hypothetical protein
MERAALLRMWKSVLRDRAGEHARVGVRPAQIGVRLALTDGCVARTLVCTDSMTVSTIGPACGALQSADGMRKATDGLRQLTSAPRGRPSTMHIGAFAPSHSAVVTTQPPVTTRESTFSTFQTTDGLREVAVRVRQSVQAATTAVPQEQSHALRALLIRLSGRR